MIIKRLLASATLLATCSAYASISIGSAAFSYTQSFDTLASTGSSAVWTNDSTLAGWSLFKGPTPTAHTTYLIDTGSSNAGGIRSYGLAGSTERALGGVGSGSFSGWIAVAFKNNTGSALAGFNIGFDGEQWRNGGNTSAQTMVMEYGFGSSFASVASWIAPGGLFNWSSLVVGATAAAVNGNTAGLVAGRGGSITTPWAVNDTLWIRWIEKDDAGNDHGLAIDNVSFRVSAVPEPSSYALMLAGLIGIGFVARRRSRV